MANPATGCTCGSGFHPRECSLHPYAFRLHVAELDVECYLEDTPEAWEAMDEFIAAIRAALRFKNDQIQQLERQIP